MANQIAQVGNSSVIAHLGLADNSLMFYVQPIGAANWDAQVVVPGTPSLPPPG